MCLLYTNALDAFPSHIVGDVAVSVAGISYSNLIPLSCIREFSLTVFVHS